jgi:hypothetical protein
VSQDDKDKPPKLEIQLDDEIAQGVYANLALVHHNETEFTLDFIYVQPQGGRAKVRSRVVIAPSQAEGLLRALRNHLAAHNNKPGGSAETARGGMAPLPEDERFH